MDQEFGPHTNVGFGRILFFGLFIGLFFLLARSQKARMGAQLTALAVVITMLAFAVSNWDIIDSIVAGAF